MFNTSSSKLNDCTFSAQTKFNHHKMKTVKLPCNSGESSRRGKTNRRRKIKGCGHETGSKEKETKSKKDGTEKKERVTQQQLSHSDTAGNRDPGRREETDRDKCDERTNREERSWQETRRRKEQGAESKSERRRLTATEQRNSRRKIDIQIF